MSGLDGKTAVLLDQYPLWLQTVEHIVHGAGIKVVGRATSSAVAEEQLMRLRPDLLVTGITMGDGEIDGLALIRRTRKRLPQIKAIVLSMYEDHDHISAAFAAGADAYVLKSAHPDDLPSAIRQAFRHSIFFSRGPAAAAVAAPISPAPIPAAMRLTPRELEILRLVAEGLPNARLARMLCVTEQTVKFHLSNVYRKLHVSNRTEASRWAQQHGVLKMAAPETAAAAG